MNDTMLLDRMAQIIRVGFVNARMPEKMRVKVTIPDTTGGELITDFLPVLCPRASQDMQYDLPDVGDQVLCLFLPYGLEQGFVIGAMYGKQAPPVQSGDKWHRLFKDGTWLEYDRESHELTAEIVGKAKIKCQESITLEAPIIYLRGKLVNTDQNGSPGKASISGEVEVTNGGVNVPDADVIAKGVSLVSHTTDGVEPGTGVSSNPTGGSAESPGTEVIILEMPPALMATNITAKLDRLNQEVKRRGSDLDKLIACLPKIAAAMAENETNEADKQGWIYLCEMFEKWLSGLPNEYPADCDEPFKIKWNWLLKFNRVVQAYVKITEKNYLFSDNARKLLAKRLERKGKLTDKQEKFDFINISWRQWRESYFQSISVQRQTLPLIPDGLMAALAAFMIYALAKGYTEPWQSGHRIVVQEVALVAYDLFNFEGVESYGYWRCDPPSFSFMPFGEKDYFKISNNDFHKFRELFVRGNDFAVISDLKDIDINKDYVYEIYL